MDLSLRGLVPKPVRRLIGRLPAPAKTVIHAPRLYVRRLWQWAFVAIETKPVGKGSAGRWLASIAASPLTSAGGLNGWKRPMLSWNATLRAKGIGVFFVRADSDDLYHILPSRERHVLEIIRRSLSKGDVFVDAGANNGVFTVLAAHLVGESGRVVAIEMIPSTASCLRRNVALNDLDNVEVVERALADTAGRIVSAIVPTRLFGSASIAHRDGAGERIDVTTTTLDEATAGIETINLLKIDLEGAERLAMAGAAATIDKCRGIIFEAKEDDISDILIQRGFTIDVLDRNNRIAVRDRRDLSA
ncbi:FkbM family methyltransferase [Sphingomonas gilva]|nr:FkbM family methyltransferase [Sphingomonas gilva]